MPLPEVSTWKARLTKRRQSVATDVGQDANMNPIAESSQERRSGSRSSSSEKSTLQLQEEVEMLRREVELLKTTRTRTDDSPRTLQVREQMEQLRLENERLRSRVPPGAYQDVSQAGSHQNNLHTPPHRSDFDQFPDGMSPRSVQAGEGSTTNKYLIETPFALSPSKTTRSQSLPKPSAPPGASISRTLVHSQSIQVVKEGHNPWLENGNVTPSSPGLASREQSRSTSHQALQASGSLHILREEKEKLMGNRDLSPRTVDGNPHSAGPGVSVRSAQELDEVASLKREIDVLKANRMETPAMSERTRHVVNQLDIARRENEMLKATKAKEMEHTKRRLAYLEQNHAAASQLRMQEIQKMVVTSQELDLAFLVDATGSMQSSIDMIKTTVTSMAAGLTATYPDCKLRVAFVPYRDYEDAERDDNEVCDFTTSFSGPNSVFSQVLSRVSAFGGGDDAEDVFSGIARATRLSWDATNRLLIHIADAPCHGRQFHDGVGDFYLNGDKHGRIIEDQLRLLYEFCHISTYLFCHLNSSTRKMIREFQTAAAGSPLTIIEEQFQNINNIPHKVITLCRGTIQKTLSFMNAQQPMDSQFAREAVVKQVPTWSQVSPQFGVHFRCKWYRALDDMLSRIYNKLALDEESMDHVQIQIAQHPFSDEGAVRWPYYASIMYPNEAPRSMVVKRFKTPLGKDIREIHKRERYLAQMEVQAVSARMADEFNKCTANMKNVKRVEFTQVTTLSIGSGPNTKFYNMESLLEGEWLRYSNNGSYVNTLDYAAVLQAFTHWTYERSRRVLMVTDLQGVRMTNAFGESVFCLCDPAIHCTDVIRFTRTNLGTEGFNLFFDTHKCNDVCDKLGLAPGKAGRTLSGTQVGSYW